MSQGIKESHRGHEVHVWRERSMGGDVLLYYSVFRESDGYECTSGFSTGSDRLADFARYLKQQIDGELSSDDPWDESATETELTP